MDYIECRVKDKLDVAECIGFIGEVLEARA